MSDRPRIAIIFIRDSAGRLFVHERSPTKRVFPGLIGFGAGGRIERDETPEVGAQRELREEAGIETSLRFVDHFDFDHGTLRYTVHFFETRFDGPIANCDEEWVSSGWRTPAEVEALLREGRVCPDTAECHRRWLAARTGAPHT